MSDAPPDQEFRAKVGSDLERSFAVEASAGTGKTTLIVSRAVALLASGRAAVTGIAIITFTDKAAAELEEKVRDGIGSEIRRLRRETGGSDEARAGLERFLEAERDLDRAPIQTIHSFASSLLRSRPVEAGVDPRFELADDETQERIFEEAWSRRVAGGEPGGRDALESLLREGVKLDDLRELAWFFVENRDVALKGEPRRTAAPDPARHARDLREWMAAALGEARSNCLRDSKDLLMEGLEAAARETERLAGLRPALLRATLLDEGWAKVAAGRGRKENWPGGKERAQELAKEWNERRGSYREALAAHLAGEAEIWIRGLVEAYQERKEKAGYLDFQDLLIKARDLLREPNAAAGLRRKYRFVLVDEFQDTDPLQVELVALLTGEGGEEPWDGRTPAAGALLFVGDPKQSIYRFRRADIDTYRRARRWIAGACGDESLVRITANFRCRPGITSWVNALFGNLFGPGEDPDGDYGPLDPRRPAGEGPALLYLVHGPVADGAQGAVRPDAQAAREAEAAFLAREIVTAVGEERWRVARGKEGGPGKEEESRPARYGDIAVLLRSFSDVGLYEEALTRERVPWVTAGGKRYHTRPEVAWFGALLGAIERPHDEVAVVAALRSPFFGLSDEELLEARLARGSLDPLAAAAAGGPAGAALERLRLWHLARNDVPLATSVRRILDGCDGLLLAASRPGGAQAALNLLKVVEFARLQEADGGTFRSFVRWLGRARDEEFQEGEAPVVERDEDAVRLMTIHKAKGLEFRVVVLADLARSVTRREPGIVDRVNDRIEFTLKAGPARCVSGAYEETAEREKLVLGQERRRLLYVGATRARDLLVVPLLSAWRGSGCFLADLDAGRAIPSSVLERLGKKSAEEAGAEMAGGKARGGGRKKAKDAGAEPSGTDGAGEAARPPGRPAARAEASAAARLPGRSAAGDEEEVLPNGGRVVIRAVEPPGGGGSGPRSGEAPGAAVSSGARPGDGPSLEAWQAEREALLLKGRTGLAFLAASRTADHETPDGLSAPAGSRAAVFSDLAGLSGQEEAREEAREEAKRFGIAVHAVLELADFADRSGLGPLAAAQAVLHGVPERAEEVRAAAERALDSTTMKRALGRRMLREAPIAFLEGGVLVEGQIDLVYEEEDGSLVVVDFKTDAIEDEAGARARGEKYRAQLALYAEAMARAAGRRVRETVLLFLSRGIELRYPHDDAARELARGAIAAHAAREA